MMILTIRIDDDKSETGFCWSIGGQRPSRMETTLPLLALFCCLKHTPPSAPYNSLHRQLPFCISSPFVYATWSFEFILCLSGMSLESCSSSTWMHRTIQSFAAEVIAFIQRLGLIVVDRQKPMKLSSTTSCLSAPGPPSLGTV